MKSTLRLASTHDNTSSEWFEVDQEDHFDRQDRFTRAWSPAVRQCT